MKKKFLAMLALCVASWAQAGWFDSYNDEVPPGLKVERAAGGTDQWNGTMFYTQSTISREGKPVVSKEDGYYYDGRKIVGKNAKLGWLHVQIGTVCQKDNTFFYGIGTDVYQVDLEKPTEPKLVYRFKQPGVDPEFGQRRLAIPIISITYDCSKMAVAAYYVPEKITNRTDTFHNNFEIFSQHAETVIAVGQLKEGNWSFKEVLDTKGWFVHAQIEPVKGEKVIFFKNGDKNVVKNKCQIMDADGTNARALVPDFNTNRGSISLCSWLGDGKTVLYNAYVDGQQVYGFVDAYSYKLVGKVSPPSGSENRSHSIAVKPLKNGNVAMVGDSYVGNIYYGEFDLKNEKVVRWAKIASHGKRLPANNKLLLNDEGWYPHPNISQDGKYVAFTSQNGVGEKGSDVYVISGLPE